ncbi:hypothetical protein PCANC_21351 [Puccinia coronata f. sp. avenae]|uniref:Uncharacterized protein n=1 Tax=Puccinia coronata f. sp. avenae TaxID=200324 RepID=A0A2N5SCY8_9BASI|nr:hypothetical protein PCANC_21351 [Puccinia coronata f. sp. avenae]
MSSFRVLLCGLTLLWLAPHWYGINATVVENSERITSGVSIESNVPRERNVLIGGEKESESLDVGFGTRPLASAESEKFHVSTPSELPSGSGSSSVVTNINPSPTNQPSHVPNFHYPETSTHFTNQARGPQSYDNGGYTQFHQPELTNEFQDYNLRPSAEMLQPYEFQWHPVDIVYPIIYYHRLRAWNLRATPVDPNRSIAPDSSHPVSSNPVLGDPHGGTASNLESYAHAGGSNFYSPTSTQSEEYYGQHPATYLARKPRAENSSQSQRSGQSRRQKGKFRQGLPPRPTSKLQSKNLWRPKTDQTQTGVSLSELQSETPRQTSDESLGKINGKPDVGSPEEDTTHLEMSKPLPGEADKLVEKKVLRDTDPGGSQTDKPDENPVTESHDHDAKQIISIAPVETSPREEEVESSGSNQISTPRSYSKISSDAPTPISSGTGDWSEKNSSSRDKSLSDIEPIIDSASSIGMINLRAREDQGRGDKPELLESTSLDHEVYSKESSSSSPIRDSKDRGKPKYAQPQPETLESPSTNPRGKFDVYADKIRGMQNHGTGDVQAKDASLQGNHQMYPTSSPDHSLNEDRKMEVKSKLLRAGRQGARATESISAVLASNQNKNAHRLSHDFPGEPVELDTDHVATLGKVKSKPENLELSEGKSSAAPPTPEPGSSLPIDKPESSSVVNRAGGPTVQPRDEQLLTGEQQDVKRIISMDPVKTSPRDDQVESSGSKQISTPLSYSELSSGAPTPSSSGTEDLFEKIIASRKKSLGDIEPADSATSSGVIYDPLISANKDLKEYAHEIKGMEHLSTAGPRAKDASSEGNHQMHSTLVPDHSSNADQKLEVKREHLRRGRQGGKASKAILSESTSTKNKFAALLHDLPVEHRELDTSHVAASIKAKSKPEILEESARENLSKSSILEPEPSLPTDESEPPPEVMKTIMKPERIERKVMTNPLNLLLFSDAKAKGFDYYSRVREALKKKAFTLDDESNGAMKSGREKLEIPVLEDSMKGKEDRLEEIRNLLQKSENSRKTILMKSPQTQVMETRKKTITSNNLNSSITKSINTSDPKNLGSGRKVSKRENEKRKEILDQSKQVEVPDYMKRYLEIEPGMNEKARQNFRLVAEVMKVGKKGCDFTISIDRPDLMTEVLDQKTWYKLLKCQAKGISRRIKWMKLDIGSLEGNRRFEAIQRQIRETEIVETWRKFVTEPETRKVKERKQFVNSILHLDEAWPTYSDLRLDATWDLESLAKNHFYNGEALPQIDAEKQVLLNTRMKNVFTMARRWNPYDWLTKEAIVNINQQNLNLRLIVVVGDCLQFGKSHMTSDSWFSAIDYKQAAILLENAWDHRKFDRTPWLATPERAWLMMDPRRAALYAERLETLKGYLAAYHDPATNNALIRLVDPQHQLKLLGDAWWHTGHILIWHEQGLHLFTMAKVGIELGLERGQQEISAEQIRILETLPDIPEEERDKVIAWFHKEFNPSLRRSQVPKSNWKTIPMNFYSNLVTGWKAWRRDDSLPIDLLMKQYKDI